MEYITDIIDSDSEMRSKYITIGYFICMNSLGDS